MNNFFRQDYLIKGLLSSLTFFLVTSWLFFDFEPLSFVLFTAAPFFVLYFKKHSMEQRRLDLITGFKDALQYMKNGLDAGSSPERSLTNAVKGLESLYGEKAEITKNFKKMSVRISTGITMEQAFEEFAKQTGVREICEFAELFKVLKRTGGNLNRVIRSTVAGLTDKISLKRDLNVVIASKKGEFNVMCVIPYGILLYLRLCAPEMSAPLYHDPKGMIFMAVVLVCYLGFYALGKIIVKRTLNV